jgi:transcriptional regulator with XRE-family HTH domain
MRVKRGFTQKKLASRINKSISAISAYESNIQTPPTDVLISIAQVLNVPLNYFVDIDSDDSYSAVCLDKDQRELLDLLFAEFTSPSNAADSLSNRQIDIIRRMMIIFSSK